MRNRALLAMLASSMLAAARPRVRVEDDTPPPAKLKEPPPNRQQRRKATRQAIKALSARRR